MRGTRCSRAVAAIGEIGHAGTFNLAQGHRDGSIKGQGDEGRPGPLQGIVDTLNSFLLDPSLVTEVDQLDDGERRKPDLVARCGRGLYRRQRCSG